jgi:predicted PilT family ATPase
MLIGSGGSRIKEIEAELGLSIDIRERGSASGAAHGAKASGAKHFEPEEHSRKGKKGKGIGAAASRAETDADDDFALEITRTSPLGERIAYELEFERKNVVAHLGKRFAGQDVTFYDGIRPLATATVNRNGEVHFAREAPQAVAISYAMRHGELDVRVATN